MKTTPKILSILSLMATLVGLTALTVFAEPANEQPNKQPDEQNSSLLGGPQVDTDASTSQPARSFDGKNKPGQRRAQMMQRLFEGIELSTEQKDQLREIAADFHTKNKTFHETHKDQLDNIHQQMRAARQSDDQEKIDELHTQMRSLRQDRPKMRDDLKQVKSLLTEEQTPIFNTNLDDMMDQMMRGPHGRPRGPRDGKKCAGKNCNPQNDNQSNHDGDRTHRPRYDQQDEQGELEI